MSERNLQLICTRSGEAEALRLLEWLLAGSASPGGCSLFFTLEGVRLMAYLVGPEQPAESAAAIAWLERHGFASLQTAFATLQSHLAARSVCRTWCEIYEVAVPDGYTLSSLPVVLASGLDQVVEL